MNPDCETIKVWELKVINSEEGMENITMHINILVCMSIDQKLEIPFAFAFNKHKRFIVFHLCVDVNNRFVLPLTFIHFRAMHVLCVNIP